MLRKVDSAPPTVTDRARVRLSAPVKSRRSFVVSFAGADVPDEKVRHFYHDFVRTARIEQRTNIVYFAFLRIINITITIYYYYYYYYVTVLPLPLRREIGTRRGVRVPADIVVPRCNISRTVLRRRTRARAKVETHRSVLFHVYYCLPVARRSRVNGGGPRLVSYDLFRARAFPSCLIRIPPHVVRCRRDAAVTATAVATFGA